MSVKQARSRRDAVVKAGLVLLNERGLDGLTLGAIAKELNVKAPTLYWRFNSKQELVDEMATQIVEEWANRMPPGGTSASWQEHANAFAQTLRRTLRTYREGARLVAGTYLTRPVLRNVMEASLANFVAAGVSLHEAALCLSSLYHFTIGFTIEEQAVHPRDGSLDAQYREEGPRNMDPTAHPLIGTLGRYFFTDYDRRFDQGVNSIIMGISHGHPSTRTSGET